MKLFLLYLSIFLVLNLFGQENLKPLELKPYNKALIWRGFKHLWSYNHRINRLGSFVFFDSLTPKGKHFSATGLGSDSTFYNLYYSYIESPNLKFFQGEAKMLVTGKETQLMTNSEEFAVLVPEWFQNLPRYKSIINGFEIKSLEKADQPVLFEIHIDDPYYSAQSKEVKFTSRFNLSTNCRSAECAILKNSSTYEVTIHYLIIGYEIKEAIAFEINNKNAYSWTTTVESKFLPIRKTVEILPDDYESAFIGIKSLNFVLNEEQWLQELYYIASINNYNKPKGTADIQVEMHFSGWKDGMKKLAVSKKEAMFSNKKPGWVSMGLNSVIFQFKQGTVFDSKVQGSMFWPGRERKANNNKGMDVKILPIKN
jgi:hypothetical protein